MRQYTEAMSLNSLINFTCMIIVWSLRSHVVELSQIIEINATAVEQTR
jgi:hypothetical protein